VKCNVLLKFENCKHIHLLILLLEEKGRDEVMKFFQYLKTVSIFICLSFSVMRGEVRRKCNVLLFNEIL
jgi:hypothetical protein